MNAALFPSPSSLPSREEESSSSEILWRPVAALPLVNRITSHHTDILQAARGVFSPWLLDGASDLKTPALHWYIETDEHSQQWRAAGMTPISPTLSDDRPDRLVTRIEYAVMQHLVSHLDSRFFGLHGALLSRENRSVLVVGPKEAGKSTLACALWRALWQLHCDDFALIDNECRVHPTARRVSLRRGSRVVLGEELWNRIENAPSTMATAEGLLFHPHEIRETPSASIPPIELNSIVFLGRREATASPAQAQFLEPASAALALLPYSTLLLPPGEAELAPSRVDWGSALPRLGALTSQVRVYDVGRGPIAAMVETVEALVKKSQP